MLYLLKNFYNRWHQYVSDRHRYQKGEICTLWGGWEDHTYHIKNVCVPHMYAMGRGLAHCYMVADGYLRWKTGVSCRTSSKMWNSWYLPKLLLRNGPLTLMNMAPLMVLITPCNSLPTMEKLSTLMQCPVE